MSLKKLLIITLYFLIPIGITFYLQNFQSNRDAKTLISQNIQSVLEKSEIILTDMEDDIRNGDLKKAINRKPNEFDIFIYDRSKLVYWSTNDYSIDSKDVFLESRKIFLNENKFGKFVVNKGNSLQHTIALTFPLERTYAIKNQFLRNSLNELIFDGLKGELEMDSISNYIKITSPNISFGFNQFTDNTLSINVKFGFVFLIILWLSMGIVFIIKRIDNPYLQILFLVLIKVSLHFKHLFLSDLLLFSPKVFASSEVQPNLFQLILNSILLYYIVSIISKIEKVRNIRFALFPIFLFCEFIILYDLVKHSSLEFSAFQIIYLDFKNILIISAIILNVILSSALISNLILLGEKYIYSFFSILLLGALLYLVQPNIAIAYLCISFIVLVLIYFKKESLQSLVVCLLLLSFFVSFQIVEKKEQKIINNKVDLITKFISGDDPYMEYLINDVSERISKDKIIVSKLKSPFYSSSDFIKNKIRKVYLNKYFPGYEFDIDVITIDQIFRNGNELRLGSHIYSVEKKEYYEDLYKLNGTQLGKGNYLKLVCFDEARLVQNIVISFNGKSNSKQSVIPQLLLDANTQSNEGVFKDFSYLILEDDIVTLKEGDLFEKISDKHALSLISSKEIDSKGYNHLRIKVGSKSILVSHKNTFINDWVNVFSLFTILLIFCLLFFLIFRQLVYKNEVSLAERLQLTFSFIVLATFISIFSATVGSISEGYRQQIGVENLRKAEKVSESIRYLLDRNEIDKAELESKLELLSINNDSDIHLYNNEGMLISSTLIEMFDKHLKSRMLSYELKENRREVLKLDNVGKFEYYSAFSPIISNSNQMLGYINIPFFDGKEELEERINDLAYSTLKISLIVFVLILLVSLYLSRRISKPIHELSQKLGNVNFDGLNETLEWSKNDEIGLLVQSYNEMLGKLSQSKEELRKKEKQEAWQQMAKQVAHEIKNPLTPMKLSLQFLQRKMSGDEVDIKDISKTTDSLINQIDNLSDIVGSFSEFASMPNYKMEIENIALLIQDVVNIHHETATINVDIEENINVNIDKKAFTGILSNLVINGVQACDVGTAVIDIKSKLQEEDLILSISDNGTGIPDDIKDKVFVPNFSTKYSGSGIGLALAKKGIEEFGGKIWFESKPDVGTTFYIELPLSK